MTRFAVLGLVLALLGACSDAGSRTVPSLDGAGLELAEAIGAGMWEGVLATAPDPDALDATDFGWSRELADCVAAAMVGVVGVERLEGGGITAQRVRDDPMLMRNWVALVGLDPSTARSVYRSAFGCEGFFSAAASGVGISTESSECLFAKIVDSDELGGFVVSALGFLVGGPDAVVPAFEPTPDESAAYTRVAVTCLSEEELTRLIGR